MRVSVGARSTAAVFAGILAAACALVTSQLGTSEAVNRRELRVSFNSESYESGPAGALTASRQRHVIEATEEGGRLVRLASEAYDADGRLLTQTSWSKGSATLKIAEVAECRVSQSPLPSPPVWDSVLEDVVGPYRDPAAAGYILVAPNVYEERDGISRTVLTVSESGSLEGVIREVYDQRHGTLLNRIFDVRQGAGWPIVLRDCES